MTLPANPINNETVVEIAKKIDAIPPLPATVTKLLEMAEDPNSDVPMISKVISNDPVLSARLLQVANSAFYGYSGKIKTVHQAVSRVGFNYLRQMALSMSIADIGRKQFNANSALQAEGFWKHSLGTAVCSRAIARLLKKYDPEEAFVGGLIHDIGKTVLMNYFPQPYRDCLDKANKTGIPLFLSEDEFFGMNHSLFGAELCRRWQMSQSIIDMVAGHHYPEQASGDDTWILVSIVSAANQISKMLHLGYSGDRNLEEHGFKVFELTHIQPETMYKILGSIQEEVREVEAFFGIRETEFPPTSGSPEPILIGVDLKNPMQKWILILELKILGFQPVAIKDPLWKDCAAVVTDIPSHSADNHPVLRFDEWRHTQINAEGFYFLPHLEEWLLNNLKPILSERP